MDDEHGIGLEEALEALRAELTAAQAKALDQDLHFPVESVTVELKIGLTKSTQGHAGFRVPWVGADLGGSTGIDRDTLQTVTVVLGAPVDREGNPVKVAQRSSMRKG